MVSRHPELARKMKGNFAGERVLDEEAMMTARAILRKEKIEDRRKRSAVGAANEMNILAAKNKKAAERNASQLEIISVIKSMINQGYEFSTRLV